MNRQSQRTGKNAFANVCRGGASAVVALALPHFLTRSLGGGRFGAWSLMLQMSALAAYFDFGVQTILGRLVAQAMVRGESGVLSRLASTSMLLLSAAGLLPLAASAFVLPFLPRLFHSSSIVVLHELQWGVAAMVVGTALSLPMSACTGILLGLHRNEVPAIAIGASRLLGAITVIVLARYHDSLIFLALCLATWNLLGGLAQLLYVRRLVPTMQLRIRLYDRTLANAIVRQSLVLTVLSFCMIVIGEVDLTIVGHYTFTAVGPYSVATTLTTFLNGLNASVCAAFYAPIAVMQQLGDSHAIRRSLERLTLFTGLINMAVLVGTYLMGRAFLIAWVGQAYADATFPILLVLLAANMIRLFASPFASGVIATGRHNALISGTIVEAAVNLPLSIIGAVFLGPIGVAYGTLAGAVVGILWILAVTSRLRVIDVMAPWSIITNAVLKPLLALAPILLFLAWRCFGGFFSAPLFLFAFLATLSTVWAAVKLGRNKQLQVSVS